MENQRRISRIVVVCAVAAGLAAGSYGIAAAASGGSAGSSGSAAPGAPVASTQTQPWGHQRSDETPLTGDTLTKVEDAAKAKVSGGTIIRVETDADGNAAYEAHMVDANGAPVTVYVDKQFDVVGVESGGPGGPGGSTSAPTMSFGADA